MKSLRQTESSDGSALQAASAEVSLPHPQWDVPAEGAVCLSVLSHIVVSLDSDDRDRLRTDTAMLAEKTPFADHIEGAR